jgi:hypothetical protein
MRRDLYIVEETRVLHEGLRLLQDCFVKIASAVRAMSREGHATI